MALCEEFEDESCVSQAQTIEQRVCTAVESLNLVPVLSAGFVDGAVRGV